MSADDNPTREWYNIATVKTYKAAERVAIRNSKKYFETEIRGYDENNDLILHQYYQKGKTIDMCV